MCDVDDAEIEVNQREKKARVDHCYTQNGKKRRAGGAYCFAYKCGSRKLKRFREEGVSFHRFPNKVKFPELHKQWVHNCKRGQPTKYSEICSKHFEEACIDRTGQTGRLREGAIPTKFAFPDHIQTKKLKPRPTQNSRKSNDSIAVPHFLPLYTNLQKQNLCQGKVDGKEGQIQEINLGQEHGYAVSNPTALKKKVEFMEQKMNKLSKELRNALVREKRLRNAVQQYQQKLCDRANVLLTLTEKLNAMEGLADENSISVNSTEEACAGTVHIIEFRNEVDAISDLNDDFPENFSVDDLLDSEVGVEDNLDLQIQKYAL